MAKTVDPKIRIETEEDFINFPKFSNSLKKLMNTYPDGVPKDSVIAKALLITEEEVEARYQAYVQKAREQMGLEDGD